MRLTVPLVPFLFLCLSCATDKAGNTDDVVLRTDPALLSKDLYMSNGFSFQTPKGWSLLAGNDSVSMVFMDTADSSMMLVNTPKPNLSAFGEAQSSSFNHNDISFRQNVYQNKLMVLFAISLKTASDSTDIYYAIPRKVIAEKASFVESSIGSVKINTYN